MSDRGDELLRAILALEDRRPPKGIGFPMWNERRRKLLTEVRAYLSENQPTPTVRESHERILSGKGTPDDLVNILGDPTRAYLNENQPGLSYAECAERYAIRAADANLLRAAQAADYQPINDAADRRDLPHTSATAPDDGTGQPEGAANDVRLAASPHQPIAATPLASAIGTRGILNGPSQEGADGSAATPWRTEWSDGMGGRFVAGSINDAGGLNDSQCGRVDSKSVGESDPASPHQLKVPS